MVRAPRAAYPSASRKISRISLTPERIAEKKMKWDLVSRAMTWARVVLPQPGGPQKIKDERLSVSIMRRRMRPSPSRCSCPVNSATLRGRMRSARGAFAETGWFRGLSPGESQRVGVFMGRIPDQFRSRRLWRPTFSGLTSQMSRAYSAMVRSLENLPMPAVLRIDLRVHSWGCR